MAALSIGRLRAAAWLVVAAAVGGLLAPTGVSGQLLEPTSAGSGLSSPDPFAPAPGTPEEARRAVEQMAERERTEERKQKEKLASPEAIAERKRSQFAHDDLSDAQAVDLLREEFSAELAPSVPDTETLLGGASVAEYFDDFTARVAGTAKRPPRIIESQVPLRAPADGEAGAKKVPVDLDIVAAGDGFKPDNGVAVVELPEESADGVKVGPIAVVPDGQGDVARVDSDTLAYPNVLTDTDLAININRDGFETFHQIRGPDAPEAQRLRFALPPGASLETTKERGARVVQGDKAMASIAPPVAVDAQGRDLPSSYEVDGSTLVIRTPHRGEDVAYPLLVDPAVTVSEDWGEPYTWWQGYKTEGTNQWNFWNPSGANWGYARQCLIYGIFNTCVYGFGNGNAKWANSGGWSTGITGLHTWASNGANYYPFTLAAWTYDPPGSTTTFDTATFSRYYQRYGHGQRMRGLTGVWSGQAGGWATDRTTNAPANSTYADYSLSNYSKSHFARTDQQDQWAMFGIADLCWTCGYGPPEFMVDNYMGAGVFALTDPDAPTITSSALSGPTGWTKTGTWGMAGTATDAGLGPRRMRIFIPLANGQTATTSRLVSCTGTKTSPCPNPQTISSSNPLTFTAADGDPVTSGSQPVRDGIHTIKLRAFDALGDGDVTGHYTDDLSKQIKVDRTAPSLIGDPTGTLYENRNRTDDHRREGLYDPQATIRAEAKDDPSAPDDGTTRSGVKSLELWVDKNRNSSYSADEKVHTQATAGCTTTQCPNKGTPLEYSLDLATLSGDGDYKVKIVGRDLADNPADLKEWTVTVDRAGDIYNARAYTGDPSATGEKVVEDWAQLGTLNGRSVTEGHISTRDAESCGSSQCGVVRSYFDPPDDPPGAAPRYTSFTADSPNDSRLEQVTEILAPGQDDLGPVQQTGPLVAAMAPWQVAPPGHGANYRMHQVSAPDGATGPAATVTKLWIDETTKLPIKEVSLDEEGQAENTVYYTYARQRQTVSEAPADLFRVPPPSDASQTKHWDWRTGNVPEAPPDQQGSENETQKATEFRQTFGLNNDPLVISDLLAAPDRDRESEDWGTPLTASEQATMALRVQVADAMDSIQTYGQQHPDRYAGAYIDQAAGGLVYVGFTGNSSDQLDALQQLFPYPSLVRTFDATFTKSQLTATAAAVRNDRTVLASQGVTVTSVSVRNKGNRVQVGVESPTASTAATLASRYGQQVDQVTGQSPTPLRVKLLDGGPAIFNEVSSPCGTGFSARTTGNGARRYFVMTAGHCTAGKKEMWYTDDVTPIGAVKFTQHDDNDNGRPEETRNVDIAYIQLRQRGFRSGYVREDSPRDRRAIKSYDRYPGNSESGTETNEGQPVCVAGYTGPNVHCGEITDESAKAGGLHSMVFAKVSGRGLCGGESGSPAYRDSRAVGILSGRHNTTVPNCGNEIELTQIEHALNRVHATLFVRR